MSGRHHQAAPERGGRCWVGSRNPGREFGAAALRPVPAAGFRRRLCLSSRSSSQRRWLFPNSGGPSQRRVEARHCARLPALIATLPSPDREIVLLRVVAGVSLPGVVAALGVAPAAIQLAHRHALSALQPAAPAPHRSPAIRGRVVLLPHARTAPTDT